jgi:hypothetical protein
VYKTRAEKDARNARYRARRKRVAEQEGRACKVGRPPLDPDELARRKRERRRAWRQTEAGRARQARKNAKRKDKLLEGRAIILRLELGII